MLKSIFEQFADLIYKQKCVVCGCSKTNEILCKNCLKTVHNLSPFAQKIIEGVNIFCAFKYDENIKILIRNFKFNRRKNAAIPCAKLLYDYFKKVCEQNSLDLNPKNSIITCVPSHPLRVLKRGYCHTELISKEFSNLSGIKTDFKIIKKVKNTLPQYKVRANQKAKNVRGAVKIYPNHAQGKTLILIDDIVTTSATLFEVISNLKKHSYNDIVCFTLAC